MQFTIFSCVKTLKPNQQKSNNEDKQSLVGLTLGTNPIQIIHQFFNLKAKNASKQTNAKRNFLRMCFYFSVVCS